MYRSPAAPPPSPTSPWLANRRRALFVHAGGHRNAHSTRGAHTAVAHAAGARVLDDGTVALATFTGGGGHHLAEHGAYDLLHESLSVAVGTGAGCAPPWAPEPPHSWHRENVLILTCAVPPNTAVFKSMDAEPRHRGRAGYAAPGPAEPPPNAEPKNVENTSLISPKPAPEKPPAPPRSGRSGRLPNHTYGVCPDWTAHRRRCSLP